MSEMISNGFFTDSKGNRLEVVDASARKRAEEAYSKAENVASRDWDKMIPALTTPFSVSGESVVCYPVSDALLKVTTRFYPRQEGKGEASPSNIRPVLPETELAFTHVKNGNVETHVHHLTNPSYGGAFLWYNGMVAENGVYKILNGQELGSDWAGWRLQTGDVAAQRYFYINIEARKDLDAPDNVEEDGAIMSHFANHPEIRTSNTVQGFRFYNVRDGYTAHARLVVRPNMADFIGGSDAETLQNWKNWLAGQEAQGTPVQIAYQMMLGVAKKEGDGMEIRAGKGENRFQNNWRGDILIVSGPLDPAWQNAQQDERISDLEESVVSGGGSYTLPVATAETLGGVKVGDGLVVDAEGRASVKPEGVYEPIDTFVVNEDVRRVIIDTEPNGLAYNFESLLLKITIDSTKVDYSNGAYIRFTNGGKYISEMALTGLINNGVYMSTAIVYPLYGRWFAFNLGAVKSPSLGDNAAVTNKPGANGINTTVDYPSITGFELYLSIDNIPAGTIIEILGVRA